MRKRNPHRSGLLTLLTGILWCCLASAAMAHAALTGAVPADGAVVEAPPKTLSLSFSEPVSPLVLKLVRPDGRIEALDTFVLRDTTLEIAPPEGLSVGTHVLTWRVVSEDGHPVGGSVVFSIGAPGGTAQAGGEAVDWLARGMLWLARTVLYAGLFFGIGGIFAVNWLIAEKEPWPVRAALPLGLLASVLSLGLQGLDALGLPLSGLFDPAAWKAGLATSFGATVAALSAAFCLAILATGLRPAALRQGASAAALVLGSGALALSGHASTASPQWLTRPAVFAHAVTIMVWIGALLPLASALRRDGDAGRLALGRFSRLIPLCVGLLALAGIVLAVIQVGTPAALLSTAYGNVLLAKIALLLLLAVLVAVNRWVLTESASKGEAKAVRRLCRSIMVESLIVLAIFAVAAAWRFTPPPRALAIAAAEPASVHIHSDKAMADVTVTPGHAGPVDLSAVILSADFAPLSAEEVTFVLSNPQAGIEPMRRKAELQADGSWRAADVALPLAGRWQVRLDVLISDFDLVRLQDTVDIRPDAF